MGEVSKPIIAKHYVPKSANALHYGINNVDQVTTTGQSTFLTFDDEQGVLTELTGDNRIPALPSIGTPLTKGDIYQFNNLLYEVRQDHNRTEHDPSTVPALFLSVRPPGTSANWMSGENVLKGDRRSYSEQLYEVIQAHVTQIDWTPPVTPALWAIVPNPVPGAWVSREAVTVGMERTYSGKTYICLQSHTTQIGWEPTFTLGVLWNEKAVGTAWAPGQSVTIGDIRTYNGNSYRCIQSHTTLQGWEPPNVPALWVLI